MKKIIIKKSQTYNFYFLSLSRPPNTSKITVAFPNSKSKHITSPPIYPLFPFLYHPSPLSTFSIFLHQSHFTIPHPFQHSPRNTLLLLKQQERYPRLTLTQRMKTNPLSKPDHTRFRILLIKTIYMSTFS